MVWPLSEVSGAILVTQVRILCVRHEPLFCFLNESLEIGSCHHFFTILCKYQLQIFLLKLIHLLIIYLMQGIEFLAGLLSLLASLLVLQCRQGIQIGIHRMDSEDADAAVWVAVRPGMSDGGIIDWQKLKNLLTG